MADATFRPIVVAPTYNNAPFLRDLVRRLLALDLPLLIVDDGCDDDTPAILDSLAAPGMRVIRHPVNRGKAAALRTAFTHALAAGFSHALTIDTDGQHDPADLPALLDLARRRPEALILGSRAADLPGSPARSMVGRIISNAYLRMETGRRIADSQCGLRVYPLRVVSRLGCRSGRYCFETEVITRMLWAGGSVTESPVACRYLPGDQRVSHFRPWLDTFRSIAMHARLILRHALPWPHRRLPEFSASRPGRSRGRPWRTWVHPLTGLREARRRRSGAIATAMALAIGAFIANLPLLGAQPLLAVVAARRFHVAPWPVLLGGVIGLPPIGPWLDRAAAAVSPPLLDCAIGSIIVATGCMVAMFGVTAPVLWRLSGRRSPRDPRVLPPIDPPEPRSRGRA